MISREEHLKQVNRFHDLVAQLDNQITNASDGEKYPLLKTWFKLVSKSWSKVDDHIEAIKDIVDSYEEDGKV